MIVLTILEDAVHLSIEEEVAHFQSFILEYFAEVLYLESAFAVNKIMRLVSIGMLDN